jgi:hypothetical protein
MDHEILATEIKLRLSDDMSAGLDATYSDHGVNIIEFSTKTRPPVRPLPYPPMFSTLQFSEINWLKS